MCILTDADGAWLAQVAVNEAGGDVLSDQTSVRGAAEQCPGLVLPALHVQLQFQFRAEHRLRAQLPRFSRLI